eukprot:8354216-Pyramimonas_sp.AAC.1
MHGLAPELFEEEDPRDSPAKPAGETAVPFSPSDVVMNFDIEMEGGVDIHAEEIAACKRAASAAISDNKPSKRTA